jgi:hypothetical protein
MFREIVKSCLHMAIVVVLNRGNYIDTKRFVSGVTVPRHPLWHHEVTYLFSSSVSFLQVA